MRRVLLLVLLAQVLFACVATAGVRVVEDEVIFTLRAPNAREVHLVGDFNNWNPTVEPMEKNGDTFEIWLFLVPGTYRYKFVVDGTWIVDPENPGDAEKGSYLTLEERAGGYALSTDEPEPEKPKPAVAPSLRYIGEFRYDNDDGDAEQTADLYLAFDRPKLRGRVDLQSLDTSWRWSSPSADVDVARAFVEARLGALKMRGFENDTTWTSRGPVTLVGDDGVFGYNAGFDRHGVSLELSPSKTILARALYVDRVGGVVAAEPRIDPDAVDAFSAGAAGDTTAYAFADTDADADQAAVELAVDASDFALGYVRRSDRGLRPGVLADIARSGAALPTTLYATRERRDAALYWLRLKKLAGFDASLGFGRASSKLELLARADVDAADGDVLAARLTHVDTDRELGFVESDRWAATLARTIAGVSLRASWDYTALDFDSRVYPPATARVHRSSAGINWRRAGWTVALGARLTDQDYGDAPATLHIDTPTLNPWLFGRDHLDVGDLIALGSDRYTDLSAAVEFTAGDGHAAWVPRSAGLDVAATVVEGVELVAARARAGFAYRAHYYALVDGRLASYEDAATFASGWVEAGYRRGPVDVNLGFGFDPVVYDPVVGEYEDIGRLRFLRDALGAGNARGDATAISERLITRERELEATGVIKLECTIRF